MVVVQRFNIFLLFAVFVFRGLGKLQGVSMVTVRGGCPDVLRQMRLKVCSAYNHTLRPLLGATLHRSYPPEACDEDRSLQRTHILNRIAA